MPTKIQKWGNSLAVRVPKRVIDALNLHAGSVVFVEAEEDRAILRRAPEVEKPRKTKGEWRMFVIPTKKKLANVSGHVDEILYEAPH
jgi:antitoxin component of MazEF toxin-antitoxin module